MAFEVQSNLTKKKKKVRLRTFSLLMNFGMGLRILHIFFYRYHDYSAENSCKHFRMKDVWDSWWNLLIAEMVSVHSHPKLVNMKLPLKQLASLLASIHVNIVDYVLKDSSPKNEIYPMIYSPSSHPRCIWLSSFRWMQSVIFKNVLALPSFITWIVIEILKPKKVCASIIKSTPHNSGPLWNLCKKNIRI